MADVAPSVIGDAIHGVSINATGATLTGALVGDWITPLNDANIHAVAINYNEDSGAAMTAAAITIEVKVGADSTVYILQNSVIAEPTNYTITLTTDDKAVYCPVVPNAPTAGATYGALRGISAIRARATITGTGAGADALKVTFIGHRTTY